MTAFLSRRRFLAALAATTAAAPALANAPEVSLRPVARGEDIWKRSIESLEDIIGDAGLPGSYGFSVGNVETGEVLEGRNAAAGLPPASVAKALTAAYALEFLGADHRFATRLLATGPVGEDGTLDGDLILAGGGDPLLDTDALAALAEDLRAAGVNAVSGRLLVWGGAQVEQRQIDPAQPDHVGYNPSVSGLNLNFNRVHFEWNRTGESYAVTMDGRSGSRRPPVSMARMVVVARRTPVYTYRDAEGRDDWTVAKGALGSGGSRWLPVRRAAFYAGEVFQAVAGAEGLRLKAPIEIDALPEETTELAVRESQPLETILQGMLKYSTNLTAEVVGCAASAARGEEPATLAESAEMMNAWAREALGLEEVALIDHSGLGDGSRIAPADMCRALVALRRRMELKPLLKPIPIRDDARRVLPNHPLDVHAKTGTLNFVSGLAGYIDCPDGTELAFAIFSGDLEHRATIPREDREGPPGARTYNTRAKKFQMALIKRWGLLYGRSA
ncbi:D-alanyl-D-alanine carboxypeptidase/D-alanyl-D-alanine endopeptidase [Roseivivax sediminis]|uniref:D-alanyl-D-alanine carboxypeptidase / D-alanyl-D-alanine-endopeptidase (Penicillin-binding protein 4) n=1 Tax=Roseivivax sediminis TaxID=936889 RepID=A0A1I2DTQ7_9RHOB|nr:D-alanyl-D-alanine carboxypeptidase/D-alanyl-D-alanine-endopeptidase [Roseivivax sediminis]SFE83906.1 D-alanyl-D-alanine carboxypeptidase / D-alanyl-D-alanine-endopeptidase (penicillin-binding protein 4) [Roseivivax sediminis]